MSNADQQDQKHPSHGSALQVSVVVPAFNAGTTIAETLESLIAQTSPHWEAIVVDDGSIDNTSDVVAQFVARDNRIRLVRQANGGESAARNSGIAAAQFEWLLFLDADDWIAPTHLERLTGVLGADSSLDAVHCGYARVTADGTRLPEKYQPPTGELFRVLARRAAFPVHTCIVRKSLVVGVGAFDTTLRKSPDWDLWQRIARTGARFGAVRDILAYYRMQPNSASLDARQMLRDGLRVLRQGHASDCRVKNPHPAYAQGMPREQMLDQQYYLLCWCAGLLIGRSEDPRSLLDMIESQGYCGLYPDAVAQCLFESAPLATCQSVRAWETLWPKAADTIDEFLAALEAHVRSGDLASRTRVKFKKLLLANSPCWESVIADLQHEQTVTKDDRDNWRRLAEQRADTLCGMEDANVRLERSNQSLVDERNNWQNLANKREETVNVLTDSLQRAAEERRVVASERDELRRTVEETRAEIDRLTDSTNQLERDKRQLEQERENWSHLASERQTSIDQLTENVRNLERQTQHVERERESALRMANDRSVAIETLLAKIQSLEAGEQRWIDERERMVQVSADRQSAIESLDGTVRRLEAEVRRAEQERDSTLRLSAERLAALDQLAAAREQLEREKCGVEQDREELRRIASDREAAAAQMRQHIDSLKSECNALLYSPERQAGDLMLNRMHLKSPVLRTAAGARVIGHRLGTAALAAEKHLPFHRKRLRVLSTICSNFPIYSQTFVHQELKQLTRQGFDLRIIYSQLDPRSNLSAPFDNLWPLKRRLILDRGIHRKDFAHYNARMPDKVRRLIVKLSEASGLSENDVLNHDNFLQAFSFTRMAEAYRPHYIHSYFFYDRSLMALVAGWMLDIPRGVSCYADHVLKDYELKVVPLHMELCDIVIATSNRIKEELLTLAPQANPDRILVKPNGIDTESFPVIHRDEPPQNAPFRIVSVCRIEPKKGLLDLVDAIHLLRQRGLPVEAHLVGAADEWSEASRNYKIRLDQRISELDLWGTIHLEGKQNHAGIERFLRLSQLFVAPFVETETGDKDGIPTALLEGMSTGLPVVATTAGSIPEVIDDGHDGILVPQRDPVAMAAAIEGLLRDPDRRQRLGQNGTAKVRSTFDVRVCEKPFHQRVFDIIGVRTR